MAPKIGYVAAHEQFPAAELTEYGVLALGDRGFTHVFVHSPQIDQRRFIEFYGAEVLPLIHPTRS